MERLTWRTSAGTPNFQITEAIRKDNIARSAFYQLACEKLADYEDNGQTPEEQAKMIAYVGNDMESNALLLKEVSRLRAEIDNLKEENDWSRESSEIIVNKSKEVLGENKRLLNNMSDLRNFACQLFGKYKTAHLGSCDGCRWKEENHD